MPKNTVNQRQFRGGYVPDEPVDEWNRSYKKEPNPPSKKRNSLQLGQSAEARPGLAGMQDFKRKKRGK
jgi:hypothetical protein